MAVELGEGQATPGDEKRRDNNISISFSFEKYTFFPYFEDVLYLPSPPILTVQRSSSIFREIEPD